MAAVCPVIGTTTNVLPPHHPEIPSSSSDSTLRCPITNATVEHHDNIISHHHPPSEIPDSQKIDINNNDKQATTMDASKCPALQHQAQQQVMNANAICPVVGPVNAHLPPDHPSIVSDDDEGEGEKVCPVTKATVEHHRKKVAVHKKVESGAGVEMCPVVGAGK